VNGYGRKREKYQAPQPEHPDTAHELDLLFEHAGEGAEIECMYISLL
jgi:hypothetical protein